MEPLYANPKANWPVEMHAAELLLMIRAVQLSTKQPFEWQSGIKAPIYCDNRVVLSDPGTRDYFRDNIIEKIKDNKIYRHHNRPNEIFIAGVATGAIGMAAIVADHMGVPMVYVRDNPKGYGKKNLIEGDIEKLKKSKIVVVIEDTVSTGTSAMRAIITLRGLGCNVGLLVSSFTYGFDEHELFVENNVRFDSITNFKTLIDVALSERYVREYEAENIKKFVQDPPSWFHLHYEP